MHNTPDSRASQTPATPPSAPKTKRRKPGSVAAALAAAATPQAHTATSEAAPDRRAASPVTAQPYPTAPSTHLAAVRLLARLNHAYQPWANPSHSHRGPHTPYGFILHCHSQPHGPTLDTHLFCFVVVLSSVLRACISPLTLLLVVRTLPSE